MLNEQLELEMYVTAPESEHPRIRPNVLIGKFSKEGALYGLESILTVIARGFLFGTDRGSFAYDEARIHAAIRVLDRWCGFSSDEEKEADGKLSDVQEWFRRYPDADSWLKNYWEFHYKEKKAEEKKRAAEKKKTEDQETEEMQWLWKMYADKWSANLRSDRHYRTKQTTYENVIANALEMGALRVRYLAFKKDMAENDNSGTGNCQEEKLSYLDYLYEVAEGKSKSKVRPASKTKLLKNVAAYYILKENHPEGQQEVLLDKQRLMNWYALNNKSGEQKDWILPQFLWKKQPIFIARSDVKNNFVKFWINPDYLKAFDFQLLEKDELESFIKEYGDTYWVMEDTGHVANSPLHVMNDSIK